MESEGTIQTIQDRFTQEDIKAKSSANRLWLRILFLEFLCILLVTYLLLLPGLDLINELQYWIPGVGIPLLLLLGTLVIIGIGQALRPKFAPGRFFMTLIMISLSVVWERNSIMAVIGLIFSLAFWQFSSVCGKFQYLLDEAGRSFPTVTEGEKTKMLPYALEAGINAFDRQMAYIILIGGIITSFSVVISVISEILALNFGLPLTTILIPIIAMLMVSLIALVLRRRDAARIAPSLKRDLSS